jgi:hypothetical protein
MGQSLLSCHHIPPGMIGVRIGAVVLSSLVWTGFQGMLGNQLQAQTVEEATITEILDSNQVYVQNRRARVNSLVRQQQQVRTGNARTSLTFNFGGIARLAPNSSLTITNCTRVDRGTILINGAFNGCTTSLTTGVRGTLYTLELTEIGSEAIAVFDGAVDVALNPQAQASKANAKPATTSALVVPATLELAQRPTSTSVDLTSEPLLVNAGQQLTYFPELQIALLQSLDAADYEALIDGPLVAGFGALPGLDDLEDTFEELFPNTPFPEFEEPPPYVMQIRQDRLNDPGQGSLGNTSPGHGSPNSPSPSSP